MPETAHQGTGPLAGGVQTTRLPLRPLIGLIAALAVMDVTMGLTYPLLALILESRGHSTALIGLNAALFPIGLITISPLVPRLVRAFGSVAFVLVCVTVTIFLLALLKILPALGIWFVLCFVLGASTGGLFVVTEAWIMELSTEATRGRVVAIYTSLLSLGFATGPLLLAWTGIEGWAPFLAGICCAALGLAVLFLVRGGLPAAPEEAPVSVLSFIPLAPALLLAVVVFAMFDTSAMSLIPLYGLGHGLDQATANYALSILIAGNVLLQFPIGWLADRMPRRHVMLGCAGVTVLGAILAPHAVGTLWQWPLYFFWGSTAFGVFTLALAELGDRFTGAQLMAGSAAFALCWGFGGILGPPLSGTAMTAMGPEGLPLILGGSFALFFLFAVWRALRSRR